MGKALFRIEFLLLSNTFPYSIFYLSIASAFFTVFSNSFATVIGPTPPGVGVIREAFLLTSSNFTSPNIFLPRKDTPASITTTPFILDSGFFGKYTFVNTGVAATITLSSASEGSVLIFKNLMTNATSTITIAGPVYSGGGSISANTAASYVFTTHTGGGGSWVSL